jgi:prepilin-type N-terminal cleavage/methylation domain-containing protein
MKNAKTAHGFSLMELLIVVAVILVISAIAIPNLLRAKRLANEASAVTSLKVINTAMVNYSSSWGVGFPLLLSYLGPGAPTSSKAAGILDPVLAAGTKSGYIFTYVSGAPSFGQVRTYTISAGPTIPQLGGRYFFTDQTGVIRQSLSGVATAMSAQIQ